MFEAAQRREKQQWAIEKPKLDDARKLRTIYSIDREDIEFTETLKHPREKVGIAFGISHVL